MNLSERLQAASGSAPPTTVRATGFDLQPPIAKRRSTPAAPVRPIDALGALRERASRALF